MDNATLLREMTQDILQLRQELQRLSAQKAHFFIANENTPTQLVANQNNYDPGNYDLLQLSSSSAINITGISGGVMGRVLRIYNAGANNIILNHESGSSTAANRMTTMGGSSVFVVPGEIVDLYYNSTTLRWIVMEYGFSGIWTPTLTNVTNITGSTAVQSQYIKKGNVVNCSGRVQIDPTAAGAAELGMSLPVASNFTNVANCGGVCTNAAVAGISIAVLADTTNDRASFQWIVVDTANRAYHFTFQYLLN